MCERREKLKNYNVQLKLLKILSDEGISPKYLTLYGLGEHVLTVKESISTPQKNRKYYTLMKLIEKHIVIFLVGQQQKSI